MALKYLTQTNAHFLLESFVLLKVILGSNLWGFSLKGRLLSTLTAMFCKYGWRGNRFYCRLWNKSHRCCCTRM